MSLGIERDGAPLADLPGDATEFIDVDLDLGPGDPHDYALVPVAPPAKDASEQPESKPKPDPDRD